MIRNLNNFIKYGVITKHNVNNVADKIMDENAIIKSKMYPFRFYQAWKNLKNDEGELSDASFNVIKYALEMAIETSLKNVPDIQGVTVVATDCSGSMGSPVNSEMTDISGIEIAGIFSAILKLKNPDSIMLPFDSNIRMDAVKSIGVGKSVTEIAKKFVASGGTALSAPYAFLINNKIKIDNFIGITDNMEWIPSAYTVSVYGNNTSSGMFVDALQKYKKTINPNVKSYLITLQGYRGAPVPPEMKDVHTIYGWNDQVLKYIGTRFDEQVKTISEMSI
jgi:60 kDa SS-A/Ro ribonucleoprotein